jgi:hypothetical protein
MKVSSRSIVLVAAMFLLSLVGCGGGQFPVRPAKGKVVCDGKPITSGSVTFTPISTDASKLETGKQASATLNSEGVFVLSTYGRFDGAIVGKHSVQFSGSGEEDLDAETESNDEGESEVNSGKSKNTRQGKKQKSDCDQKEEIIVEVTARGENNFTIELTPKGK